MTGKQFAGITPDPVRIRVLYTGGSLDIGGAERVALELMGNIDPRTFQVFFLVREADSGRSPFEATIARAEARGMVVIRKPNHAPRAGGGGPRDTPGRILALWPAARRVIILVLTEYRYYRAIRPDVIHLHLALGFEPFAKKLIARAAGIPVVVTTYHQFPVVHGRPPCRPARDLIDATMLRCMDYLTLWGLRKIDDAMIATSPEEASAHVATGIPAHKVVVISEGIDLTPYETPPSSQSIMALRSRYGIPPEAFVFGHIGRLCLQKAQRYLIEAAMQVFREFPHAWLVIIGEGEDRPALTAQIGAIGDAGTQERILMPGAIPDTGVAACHFMFDAFVLSSRFEGQGLVNMEAMAASRPIIATRVGGVASTLGEEAGLLVAAEDSQALAMAMRTLLLDGDLRRRMGEAGRPRAFAQWGIERVAQLHQALYISLLARRGLTPGRLPR